MFVRLCNSFTDYHAIFIRMYVIHALHFYHASADKLTANGPDRLVNDTCSEATSRIAFWNDFDYNPVCGNITYDISISPSIGVLNESIEYNLYNFSGLEPGTNYTITVSGINMAGRETSRTETFSVATLCDSSMPEDTSSGKFAIMKHSR